MVVRESLQHLARARPFGDPDYQSAARVLTFQQVCGSVADFRYMFRIGDAELVHQALNHRGMWATPFDFIARNRRVDPLTVHPAETCQQRIDNVPAESSVERDLDAR